MKLHNWLFAGLMLLCSQIIFCAAALSQSDGDQNAWGRKTGVSTGSGLFGWIQTNTSPRASSEKRVTSRPVHSSNHVIYRPRVNSGHVAPPTNWQPARSVGWGSTGLGQSQAVTKHGGMSSGGWGPQRPQYGSGSEASSREKSGEWKLSAQPTHNLSEHSSHALSDYSSWRHRSESNPVTGHEDSNQAKLGGSSQSAHVTAWGHSASERSTDRSRGPAAHSTLWGLSSASGSFSEHTTAWGHKATEHSVFGNQSRERPAYMAPQYSTGWGRRDGGSASTGTFGFRTRSNTQSSTKLGSAKPWRSSFH